MTDTSERARIRRGRHSVSKPTLLRYLLSITEQIASVVANQGTTFIIIIILIIIIIIIIIIIAILLLFFTIDLIENPYEEEQQRREKEMESWTLKEEKQLCSA